MEIIKENRSKPESITKPMNEMQHGEVCWFSDQYILKVSHGAQQSIYLILDNHIAMNSYAYNLDCKVRELYPGESITIKFS